MSTSAFAGDDPRDADGEVKLSLPETWPVESMGKCDVLLGELGRVTDGLAGCVDGLSSSSARSF